MLLGQILTTLTVSIGFILAYFLCKRKNIEIKNGVFKIISGVLAVVFFFRYMLGYEALDNVFMITGVTEVYHTPLNLSGFMVVMGFIAFWSSGSGITNTFVATPLIRLVVCIFVLPSLSVKV